MAAPCSLLRSLAAERRLESCSVTCCPAPRRACGATRASASRPLLLRASRGGRVRVHATPAPSRVRGVTATPLDGEDSSSKGEDDGGAGLGWEVIQENGEDYEEGESEENRRPIPAEMRCFDRAKIYIKAGDGGNGATAFRREAQVALGGPAGGTGGDGGNVWVVGDASMNSLTGFRRKVHFRAERGGNGGGKNCTGREGTDVTISVPLGTIIRNPDTSEVLAEVLTPDEPRMVLRGGRGGKGNAAFKSNKNKAPMISEKGEEGLEMWLRLELQVVADVGIVGVPNAGKSTLLASLSAARPKIASYPFTTLVPNLGVCEHDYQTTVFADIPGLVEGAHLGVGLGHQFLRHCLRCRVLVHLLDGTADGPEGPLGDYAAIQTELAAFSPLLAGKPQIVALNKLDVPDSRLALPAVQAYLQQRGVEVYAVSAATGEGVPELVRAVRRLLAEQPQPEAAPEPTRESRREAAREPIAAEAQRAREGDLSAFEVVRDGKYFVVEGAALARFAQMTNWEFFESVKRFQYVLKKVGVWDALISAGVKEGDPVVIGQLEMEWAGEHDEGRLYERWLRSQAGIGARGTRHWPH